MTENIKTDMKNKFKDNSTRELETTMNQLSGDILEIKRSIKNNSKPRNIIIIIKGLFGIGYNVWKNIS